MSRLRGLWLRTQGFVRRHAMALAIAILTICSALAVGGLVWEANQRANAFCDAIEDNRRGLTALIDVVLEDDQGGGRVVNLDALPEFQAVSPEVQALVRVLVNPPRTEPGDDEEPDLVTRLRTFRDTLVVEGC